MSWLRGEGVVVKLAAMSQEAPDLGSPDDTMTAVGAVSLRLLAGAVSRKTMEQLKRTVQENPSEYPWQVVTHAILAEPCDEQKVVQQGLRAHRDWIVRGGRQDPGRPLGVQAKTLVAKLLTQLIVVVIIALLVCLMLLVMRQKWPGADIYKVLFWLQDTFPGAFPKAG